MLKALDDGGRILSNILIVDDEPAVLFMLRELLEERGHQLSVQQSSAEVAALAALGQLDELDLVLTDFAMPELDGLELLKRLKLGYPELPVVLLTARGSERLAARAIKEGAFDYVPKPFEIEELEAVVGRALELGGLRRVARRLDAQSLLGRPLVGKSAAFRAVVERALRVAKRDLPVIVRGETGTGKELLAALLHAGSARASRPLVRFNCAAIAEQLAESELFGHVRGAFTGASSSHRGFFSRANGGTLVLDEIGDLPTRLQPKLLRTLQSGEIQPVGSSAIERVDVRVVACTHRDLLAEARLGRFREDLFYRLSVVELVMPPLRERRDDIPALAEFFARAAADRFGIEGIALGPDLLRELGQRDYPGNVRELENLVTRLVALSEGGPLDASALDLPPQTTRGAERDASSFREQVELLERSLLTRALEESGFNQSEAARRLQLSRATFLDKLKRYGIG